MESSAGLCQVFSTETSKPCPHRCLRAAWVPYESLLLGSVLIVYHQLCTSFEGYRYVPAFKVTGTYQLSRLRVRTSLDAFPPVSRGRSKAGSEDQRIRQQEPLQGYLRKFPKGSHPAEQLQHVSWSALLARFG